MTLTAILIGNESLTAECGNLWLDRGHAVTAVVTRAPHVASWAAKRGLTVVAPGPGLAARLPGHAVDWVISVANLSLVPAGVLALARQGGVNFHDGPLPGYAGLNAPVWALLNAERQHAVTWHLMTSGIDEGEVLATSTFDITADETAFTLNARCFAAALDSFPQVITALEAGGQPRQPQGNGPRRMFRRADRPAAAARLDFTKPAETVAGMVRALDHGGYRNPLAVAKILVGGRILAVGAAEITAGSAVPGTVLDASDASLVVACATGAVRLMRLTDLQGNAVSPTSLNTTHLPSPDVNEAAALTAALAPVAEAEALCRAILASPDPVVLGGPPTVSPDWQSLPLALSNATPARLALAALRAIGRTSGDIAFSGGPSPVPGYVTPWVPLRLAAAGPAAAAEALAEVALDAARAATGLAADLALREPGLGALIPAPLAISAVNAPLEGTAVTLT
ncbi:formyltransferase family protein, partial [Tabrizicola sp.]|uniref:formyltransferase family protein n=1 Tax=Tabrizicola sp. TaxID=2005166 RepID=UPI00286BC0E1